MLKFFIPFLSNRRDRLCGMMVFLCGHPSSQVFSSLFPLLVVGYVISSSISIISLSVIFHSVYLLMVLLVVIHLMFIVCGETY